MHGSLPWMAFQQLDHPPQCAQVEDMEDELDQDTTSALDGIVGSYEFNDKQLQVFQELVKNMRGAAWGLLAATAVTVVLSATKQVAPAPASLITYKEVVTMPASPLMPATHKLCGQSNIVGTALLPDNFPACSVIVIT